MEQWLIFSLIATACWGIYNFALKIFVGKGFLGYDVKFAALFIVMGITITFATYFLISGEASSASNINFNTALFGIFLGIVWGIGTIITLFALHSGANISKMTPIFNLSIILTVSLGIILLKELPDKGEAARVIVGAILTITGATLVAM